MTGLYYGATFATRRRETTSSRSSLVVLGATVAPSASRPAASPRNDTDAAAAGGKSAESSSPPAAEFLDELRRLAEQANDPTHNPIAAAARTEDAWRQRRRRSRTSRTDKKVDDLAAFNIVLRAWRDCCHTLAENDVKFDASDQVPTSWSLQDSSTVPSSIGGSYIITPHDAARHALQLLTDRTSTSISTEGDGISGATDTLSHNLVMDAFVKSRHRSALSDVTAIFQRMQEQHRHEKSSSSSSSSGGGDDASSSCAPDSVSWNTLLEATTYAEGDDRLDRVERVWKQMQRSSCRPNTRTINTVLHAYGRSERGTTAAPATTTTNAPKNTEDWDARAERCEEVFRSMTDQPDAVTYTNLMMVHSRRGTVEAAERVESLFRELKHRNDAATPALSDRFRPTVYTYTALIHAWGSVPTRDAAPKAEEWLQQLLNDTRVQPNTKCYNACLQAWSRSTDPIRAAKALMLLQQMKKNSFTYPNRVSYLSALSSCKITNGSPLQQTAALKVAFAAFKSAEMDSLHHGLYGSLLRVVATLLPPESTSTSEGGGGGGERDNVSSAVFRKAVKDGRVTKDVVRALQQATSAETFHSLLDPAMVGEHGEVLFHKIPPSWSKNAR